VTLVSRAVEESGVEHAERERARLLGLAYRMLGSVVDAEDDTRLPRRPRPARPGRASVRLVVDPDRLGAVREPLRS
jgi:hypothetical protein